MSETIDKPKNLIPILTQKLTEILDETKKPMTICEIQEKYNLSFPFQVRKVVNKNSFPEITTIKEIKYRLLGLINETCKVTNNRYIDKNNNLIYQNADKYKYYVLHEEN